MPLLSSITLFFCLYCHILLQISINFFLSLCDMMSQSFSFFVITAKYLPLPGTLRHHVAKFFLHKKASKYFLLSRTLRHHVAKFYALFFPSIHIFFTSIHFIQIKFLFHPELKLMLHIGFHIKRIFLIIIR